MSGSGILASAVKVNKESGINKAQKWEELRKDDLAPN